MLVGLVCIVVIGNEYQQPDQVQVRSSGNLQRGTLIFLRFGEISTIVELIQPQATQEVEKILYL